MPHGDCWVGNRVVGLFGAGGRDRTWGLEFSKRPALNSCRRPSVVIPSLLFGGQGLPELSRLVLILLRGPGRP